MPPTSTAPANTPTAGVRQQQREETAARIEQTALALFEARGFDGITGEEIADAAGVSRRTFVRYYPGGKEEVIIGDLRNYVEALPEIMTSRPPHEPVLLALRHTLHALCASYEDDHETARRKWEILATAPPSVAARAMGEQLAISEQLIHMVALRLAADPVTDFRPQVIVTTALGAFQVALQRWLMFDDVQLPALLDEVLDAIEAGLADLAVRAPQPR